MVVGLIPNEELSFIFREDRQKDQDDPTRSVFSYRTLASKERTKLTDRQGSYDTTDDKVSVNMGSVNWLACKVGLTGWEKFVDANGEQIPFEKEGVKRNHLGVEIDAVTDATLDRLTDDQIEVLGSVIRKAQRLSPTDVKN